LSAHLVDSGVWVALAIPDHVHHERARQWLDPIDEPAALIFCRATQQSLLRLLTSAVIVSPYGRDPLTNRQAWSVVEELMSDDRIVLRPDEPVGLDSCWRDFALRKTASPKLWMDAYLAAYAVVAGLQLVTTDAAFRQFSGLDLRVLGQGGAAK
jgi:toxin-antitoxin system PIN domain toxin